MNISGLLGMNEARLSVATLDWSQFIIWIVFVSWLLFYIHKILEWIRKCKEHDELMKSNQNLGMAGISIVFHDAPTAQRKREKGLDACTVIQVGNDASIDTPFATPRRHGEGPECLPESETSEATSSGTTKPDIPSPDSTEPTNKPQSTATSDTKIRQSQSPSPQGQPVGRQVSNLLQGRVRAP